MTVKRKRPWWLGWVPAAVLVALIAATITTTAVLSSNGLGEPVPRPTEGQVTDKNWSIFTEEGLAYIDSSREVRLDLSKAPVAAAPLGLEPDATITIGPKDNGDVLLDYYLIVNGGGAGVGGDKFTVSQLSITTSGGVVTHVTAPLSEVLNFRQTLSLLQAKAELFGWDISDVEAIYDQVADATQDGVPYEFTFGPADAAGVPVSATANCDTTGYCVVEYDVAPAVR